MTNAYLRLDGRLLFLSTDPDLIERQLNGADLGLEQAGALRDDVSTDEITPIITLTRYDERLGRYPYVGLKAGERLPIGVDAVKNGHFVATVAGKRYGKGSSREHSPIAELHAGIRLVIAAGFERIYRQNADNVGLFTSTDFGLIERIRAGEAIPVEELVASREHLAAAILRHGGLLSYGRQRMHKIVSIGNAGQPRPQTLVEKILTRHLVRSEVPTQDTSGATGNDTSDLPEPGKGAFVRADWRFIHEYYTAMCTHMLHQTFGTALTLHEPDSIIAFEDHLSYAHRSEVHQQSGLLPDLRHLSDAHRAFIAAYKLRAHGVLPGGEGSEGISHAMMAESYALPGQVVAGTDSHTPHSGALGCVAFGVGSTDMANGMVTGAVRLTVPPSLLIDMQGARRPGITAKDLVLHLLAHPAIRSGLGVGKAFEFSGPVVAGLSIDERATLTNMVAELGGFTGIVAPDQETVRFLRQRRGVEFVIEPWMRSDPGAAYADVIRMDCSSITPMVARPGDPGNGLALGDLQDKVKVDIAYGGSCTAGKREDFDHYHEVLAWGLQHGLRVPPRVHLYLQFGTTAVRDYCVERGYLETFEQAGAEMLQPACGACANCGPGSSTSSGQVTVSAINRNFPGRSGPGSVWLASPPTVVASALAGELMSFADLQQHHAI